jgi:hypothetical protein
MCETNACVEVAVVGDGILVRDSKHPNGPVLKFDTREWDDFRRGVANGEFRFPKPHSWR